MAQPLQYQSQFVPTDFGTVGNMLGMFRQDMAQRDQLFDQSAAMEQKYLTDLYGLETFDPEIIGSRVDNLAQKMQEAVDRRGGDYGAAAKDIARLGTRELANPIYKLNQRKLEQSKLLERALANNPNLMVLRDPRNIDLNENLDPTDIGYDVLDPAQVERAVSEIYGDLARQRREGKPVYDPETGYNVATTTLGATPEEIQAMMQDPETYNRVASRFPQLEQYLQDPAISQQIQSRVNQGLRNLSLGQQRQYIRPLTQSTSPGKLTHSAAIGSLYTPSPEVQPRMYRRAERAQEQISQITDESGMVQEPKIKGRKAEDPTRGIGKAGAFGFRSQPDPTVEVSNKQARAFEKFNKYKDNYKSVYDNVREQGGTDQDFLDVVTNLEKNKSYVQSSQIGFNDPDFAKNVMSNLSFKESQFTELNELGEKTNKDISFKQYTDKYKDTGMNHKESKVFLSPDGKLIVQDNIEGKQYAVNKESLPTTTRKYLNTLESVFDSFYDYSMSKEDINQLNDPKNWFTLGGGVHAKVVVPEGNVLNKKLVIAFPDPATGQLIQKTMDSPDEFYGYVSQLVNADMFKGK